MSRVIHYEDLALAIEPDGQESYQVHALSSPYGLTAAPFALPFCRQELEGLIEGVASSLVQCWGAESLPRTKDPALAQRQRQAVQNLHEAGGRLFRALFHENIREIYLLSKGRSESTPDRGLRIRLVLPIDSPDSALLQTLPWELLYCEQTDDFLARSVLTPIVRQLVIPWASSSFSRTAEDHVRILIAMSAPEGTSQLDEEEERARILQAWGQREGADIEVLPAATLVGLREALRSERYDVVHFIGHGKVDAATAEGYLLFETANHEPHYVSGRLLAEALRESREIRLVFLNSCRSGQLGYRPGENPLLGVAAALVRRGMPAVLAMQFPISDLAAKVFSEAVYRSLARGSSLEAAVGDGKFAIHQTGTISWEWLTPVLFTALSRAQIFEPLCAPPQGSGSRFEEVLLKVGSLLGAGTHGQARQLVESCLEKGHDAADLHYYRALAFLGNRRPRSLPVMEFRQVEASAARAVELKDRAAHHMCLLAFLFKDFYIENYLRAPAPGYDELLRLAAASPRRPDRLEELARLAPGTRVVVDLVTGGKEA